MGEAGSTLAENKTLGPVQRKMLLAIVLLLVVNIVLVAKISAQQPKVC